MKTCATCNQTKPLQEFSQNSANKDKLSYLCRPCSVAATQVRQKTLKGLVKKIYNNQKMTTKAMQRPAPGYTEAALFDWMLQHNYEALWTTWVASGYDKWLSPSIDRKDNTASYTLQNIQLITWRENLDNQKKDNISGKYLHTHSKAVDQLTLDGEYIQTFSSAANASRAILGKRGCISNITYVCSGKYRTAYGFKWRFTNALS